MRTAEVTGLPHLRADLEQGTGERGSACDLSRTIIGRDLEVERDGSCNLSEERDEPQRPHEGLHQSHDPVMTLVDMSPLVFEHCRQLAGFQRRTQMLRQHHSPVPARQGEGQMPVAADHPDGPSCQLDVDGLPAEDSSRRSVLAVPPSGQKPTADEESEGDEQRQEEEENDGDERVDLSTAERVRRNEAALAHITDGHRQHIGAFEQPSRHEAESGHHSPGQHRQGEEREHRQARDAHEDRRG